MSDLFQQKLLEIQRDFHSVAVPHPGQLVAINSFFVDWKTGVFLRCGRKTGKTYVAIYCAWKFACLFPNSEVYYILPEKEHGRTLLWQGQRLQGFFSTQDRRPGENLEAFAKRRQKGKAIENKYVKDINNSTLTILFKNGSFLTVDGSKNYPNANGLQPTFCVMDEYAWHDPRYDETMRPNLDSRDGRLLMVGTPPPIGQGLHFLETEKEFQRAKDKVHYLMPSYLNEGIYPGGRNGQKFQDLEASYKARDKYHVFAREYLCMLVPDATNAVFPHLEKKKHVFPYAAMMEELENSYRDWDFYMTYDPGSVTVFAVTFVAINRKDKRFWVFDELYETQQKNMTVKYLFPLSRRKAEAIHQFFEDWILTYDSAAAWFANEVSTNHDVGMLPCDKTSRKGEGKQDQLMVLRSAIQTGRFAMSDRCAHTYKEMISYSRDEDTGKLPKKDDHAIDSLRYTMRTAAYDDEEFNPNETVEAFPRTHYSIDDDWARAYDSSID